MMFGQSAYSRATSTHDGDLERRLQSLERQLEYVGGRAAAGASQATNGLGDTVASVLSHMAGRFSGGGSMSGEAVKFGNEATNFGMELLLAFTREVEHRPLVRLAMRL